MINNYLDIQVSLYRSHSDNRGVSVTLRDVLFERYKKDVPIIEKLRALPRSSDNYKSEKLRLKNKLRCFSPAALLGSKAAGEIKVVKRSGLMQLDFDAAGIEDYDIEELKKAVFELPFVAVCSLSCSGDGFYALVLIAEPEKLKEYAEQCFEVFGRYGVKVDQSKGRNVQDLRYVSQDSNVLIRENPTALKIINFYKKTTTPRQISRAGIQNSNTDILNAGLAKIKSAVEGERWHTVQKVAYTAGGFGNSDDLNNINAAILETTAFAGIEEKYLKCAADCFAEGARNLWEDKKEEWD